MNNKFEWNLWGEWWKEWINKSDELSHSWELINNIQNDLFTSIQNGESQNYFNSDLMVVQENLAEHKKKLKNEMQNIFKSDFCYEKDWTKRLYVSVNDTYISTQRNNHERILFIDEFGNYTSWVKNTIYTKEFLKSWRNKATRNDIIQEFTNNEFKDIKDFLFTIVPDIMRKLSNKDF